MESIKQWILTIAACVLILAVIDMIVPKGASKKTVTLVAGFILSACIILPIFNVYNDIKGYVSSASVDGVAVEGSRMDIVNNKSSLPEEQIARAASGYKEQLNQYIQKLVCETDGILECSANAIINEDYTSDDFGVINKLYLTVKEGSEEAPKDEKKKSSFSDEGRVKRIEITVDGIKVDRYDDENDENDGNNELIESLKEILSKELSLTKENIFIETK